MSNSYYTSTNTAASKHTTGRSNTVNDEFQLLEEAFDKLPSEDQLKKNTSNYAADTGAANAYLVTLSPAPTTYTDGMSVVFKATNANTGASTINVNGLGVKSLKRQTGAALVSGDIVAGSIYEFRYNGTDFIAMSFGRAEIATVSGIASDVTTVAGISADVTAVAGDAADIGTVAAADANIGTVATNIAGVNSVAGNASNINSVAGNSTNINTVATNSANISSVAGNATNINAVATNESNINAAVANASNINAAVANETNINAAPQAATDAANAQSYSEEWANKAEDSLISAAAGGNEVDEYSAKHHAAKAAASAASVGTEFDANTFRVRDNTDNTKKVAFGASGISTATTRTLTVPNSNGTLLLQETLNTYINTRSDLGSSVDTAADKLLVVDASDSNTLKTINPEDIAGGGGLVFISSQTVSTAVSAIDITSGIDSTYDEYIIKLYNVQPVSDTQDLYLRTSSNSGSSFDSGGTDYYYGFNGRNDAGGTVIGDGQDSFIQIASSMGNATNENGWSGEIRLFRPSESQYGEIFFQGRYASSVSNRRDFVTGIGTRVSAAAINGIRILSQSGNIDNGIVRLYGVVKS